MSISQTDASEALRQIEEANIRSLTLRSYSLASPHLILWGVAYFVAYTANYIQPTRSGLIWGLVVPAAVIGDVLVTRYGGRTNRLSAANRNILAGIFVTLSAFITATALIMQPHDPRQMAAFVPLVVAVSYILLGLGQGIRLILTGVALGVLTMVGYFALPSSFMLWMAAVGGGALISSGLWLRQV